MLGIRDPRGHGGKEFACQCRRHNPFQLFLPRKFHAQRSLAGYSPWGCKQSDMTEQLSTFQVQYSRKAVIFFYHIENTIPLTSTYCCHEASCQSAVLIFSPLSLILSLCLFFCYMSSFLFILVWNFGICGLQTSISSGKFSSNITPHFLSYSSGTPVIQMLNQPLYPLLF